MKRLRGKFILVRQRIDFNPDYELQATLIVSTVPKR